MSQPLPHTEHGSTPIANPAHHPRRWLRFSLRTFLLFTLVLGVFFGWLGNILVRVRKQREIAGRIEQAGGDFEYDYELAANDALERSAPPGPKILRILLGEDAFAFIESVNFREQRTSDSDLSHLVDLPRLRILHIDGLRVTDAGVRSIQRIQTLKSLGLDGTNVTEDGLSSLVNLKNLRRLTLSGNTVNNESIRHIDILQNITTLNLWKTSLNSNGMEGVERLTNLRRLSIAENPGIDDKVMPHLIPLTRLIDLRLPWTGVTDEGLAYLPKLAHLEMLNLSFCRVSDAGMKHVAALSELKELTMYGVGIGDPGISLLKRLDKLEYLALGGTPITDAASADLAELRMLKSLLIFETGITDAGLRPLEALTNLDRLEVGPGITLPAATELKSRLPKCRIRVHGVPGKSYPVELQ